MLKKIKKKFTHYKYDKALKILTQTPAEKIKLNGESLVIPAIKRIVKTTPAYQQILKRNGIDVNNINNLEDFTKFPITDKLSTFEKFSIEELCQGGNLDKLELVMTSSGFSKKFSYGIITEGNEDRIKDSIDIILNYGFDLKNKKTFMINALPMGVKFKTSLDIANTSVREDMVFSIVNFAKNRYERTLIVSDPHFIKKIIEDGIENGIDWKELNVSFVLGEDWFSNSFTNYLNHLIGGSYEKDFKNTIVFTMGITELDLNMFHSSRFVSKIRDVAQKDDSLREALFGEGIKSCPELMHYYPHRTYLEVLNQDKNGFGELVFTMLSPALKMALIRYNSKDKAKIFTYNEVEDILKKFGYDYLIPDLKLPFVAIYGREDKFVQVDDKKVTPEDLKEALYRDYEVAGSITGYFRMSVKEKEPVIEIQLKENIEKNQELVNKIKKQIFEFIECRPKIVVYEYKDFPYSMQLDYETKFRCI